MTQQIQVGPGPGDVSPAFAKLGENDLNGFTYLLTLGLHAVSYGNAPPEPPVSCPDDGGFMSDAGLNLSSSDWQQVVHKPHKFFQNHHLNFRVWIANRTSGIVRDPQSLLNDEKCVIAFYRSLSFIERQMKRFPDDPHQQNAVQRWLYSRIVTFLLAGGHVETLPEYMGGRQSEMDAALGNLTPQQLQDAFPVDYSKVNASTETYFFDWNFYSLQLTQLFYEYLEREVAKRVHPTWKGQLRDFKPLKNFVSHACKFWTLFVIVLLRHRNIPPWSPDAEGLLKGVHSEVHKMAQALSSSSVPDCLSYLKNAISVILTKIETLRSLHPKLLAGILSPPGSEPPQPVSAAPASTAPSCTASTSTTPTCSAPTHTASISTASTSTAPSATCASQRPNETLDNSCIVVESRPGRRATHSNNRLQQAPSKSTRQPRPFVAPALTIGQSQPNNCSSNASTLAHGANQSIIQAQGYPQYNYQNQTSVNNFHPNHSQPQHMHQQQNALPHHTMQRQQNYNQSFHLQQPPQPILTSQQPRHPPMQPHQIPPPQPPIQTQYQPRNNSHVMQPPQQINYPNQQSYYPPPHHPPPPPYQMPNYPQNFQQQTMASHNIPPSQPPMSTAQYPHHSSLQHLQQHMASYQHQQPGYSDPTWSHMDHVAPSQTNVSQDERFNEILVNLGLPLSSQSMPVTQPYQPPATWPSMPPAAPRGYPSQPRGPPARPSAAPNQHVRRASAAAARAPCRAPSRATNSQPARIRVTCTQSTPSRTASFQSRSLSTDFYDIPPATPLNLPEPDKNVNPIVIQPEDAPEVVHHRRDSFSPRSESFLRHRGNHNASVNSTISHVSNSPNSSDVEDVKPPPPQWKDLGVINLDPDPPEPEVTRRDASQNSGSCNPGMPPAELIENLRGMIGADAARSHPELFRILESLSPASQNANSSVAPSTERASNQRPTSKTQAQADPQPSKEPSQANESTNVPTSEASTNERVTEPCQEPVPSQVPAKHSSSSDRENSPPDSAQDEPPEKRKSPASNCAGQVPLTRDEDGFVSVGDNPIPSLSTDVSTGNSWADDAEAAESTVTTTPQRVPEYILLDDLVQSPSAATPDESQNWPSTSKPAHTSVSSVTDQLDANLTTDEADIPDDVTQDIDGFDISVSVVPKRHVFIDMDDDLWQRSADDDGTDSLDELPDIEPFDSLSPEASGESYSQAGRELDALADQKLKAFKEQEREDSSSQEASSSRAAPNEPNSMNYGKPTGEPLNTDSFDEPILIDSDSDSR